MQFIPLKSYLSTAFLPKISNCLTKIDYLISFYEIRHSYLLFHLLTE